MSESLWKEEQLPYTVGVPTPTADVLLSYTAGINIIFRLQIQIFPPKKNLCRARKINITFEVAGGQTHTDM